MVGKVDAVLLALIGTLPMVVLALIVSLGVLLRRRRDQGRLTVRAHYGVYQVLSLVGAALGLIAVLHILG